MSEKEEGVELTEENELVVSGETITDPSSGEVMSIEELAESLKEQEQGMEVTSVYYEFPMGKEVRCYYIGDTNIKGKQGEVPAVRMLMSDGSIAITASAVVVSTFKDYPKMKAFSVKRIGEEQGPNGKYFTYKIYELLGK